MKKVLIFLLLIIFTCCKKDNSNGNPAPGPVPNPNNKMQADVAYGGNSFHLLAEVTTLEKRENCYQCSDSVIIVHGIMGENLTARWITLFLVNIQDTGNYYFGEDSITKASVTAEYGEGCLNCQIFYLSISSGDKNEGEVLIESISDRQIKGTFKAKWGDSTNMVELTNGSFTGDIEIPK